VRAAIYARVSTTDQNCDMQLRELRDYCQRRGWEIAGEYVELLASLFHRLLKAWKRSCGGRLQAIAPSNRLFSREAVVHGLFLISSRMLPTPLGIAGPLSPFSSPVSALLNNDWRMIFLSSSLTAASFINARYTNVS
jgi:hypothetical protein